MSRKRSVGLKTIAEDLGLSVMAVSKALRGHTDISAETRRKVLERARHLNYRPNVLPLQMLTGRTRSIGMIVPTLQASYFADLVHGVTEHIRREGYQLLLCNSDMNLDQESEHIQSLLAHRVEAIVLCPAGPLEQASELQSLLESGVPYVLAGRGTPGFKANFVGSDGRAIGHSATEHLIQQGCRRIAHIQGPAVAGGLQRRDGFLAAMAKHRLRVQPGFLAGPGDGIEAGYTAMSALLERMPLPDGVVCYTDLTAGGAMKAVLEAGLNIPGDVALVGVGNLLFSDLLRVPLSTIDQDPITMGRLAATVVLDMADGRPVDQPVRLVVPSRLIQRESSSLRVHGGRQRPAPSKSNR